MKCNTCDVSLNQFVQLKSGKIVEQKFCHKCWKLKNIKNEPKSEADDKKAPQSDEAATMFLNTIICSIDQGDIQTTTHRGRIAVVLSHHIFSSERRWMQKPAEGQPKLKMTVFPCSEMYGRFKMEVPRVAAAQIEGLADAGAQ